MESQIAVEQGTAGQPPHIGGLNEQAVAELAPHTQIHVHAVGVAQPLIDVTNESLDARRFLGKASRRRRPDQLDRYIERTGESRRGYRAESSRGVRDRRRQPE